MFRAFRFAACTAAFLVLAGLAPGTMRAQKPVETKSVDEPGRTPYQGWTDLTTCTGICTFTFPTVPAGYRLVVTYASMFFDSPNGSSGLVTGGYQIDQQQNPPLAYLPLPSAVPGAVGFPEFVLSTPVSFYVDAGNTPNLRLFGSFSGFYGQATLTGYLVQVP